MKPAKGHFPCTRKTTHQTGARTIEGTDRDRIDQLLSSIQWSSDYLHDLGVTYPALPAAQMQLLEAAARGHRIADDKLQPVLAKAEELKSMLDWSVLKHPPRPVR
jgi:hypothetical protein